MTFQLSGSGEPLDAIVRALDSAHGLDISVYDESFLLKSVNKRLIETGLKTVASYGEYLAENREEAEAFCNVLRINYSEFFRSPLTFALLEQQILPGLIAEKVHSGISEIRIWSAGCAAGQEAWSIAILLDELIGARERQPSYRIFATDLSEPDLAAARAGVYSADAMGNVRQRHLCSCFSQQGGSYAVIPRLRARVDFSAYDLLDEHSVCPAMSLYGDFDLILCCNLLFYYQPDIRQQIMDKICCTLSPGGYFVTGEAERESAAGQQGLRTVVPSAAVFQKRGKL